MRFLGATWRRSGMSKAAMRAYYNNQYGPIVAKDTGEIYCYEQNVVEDSVFYCKDAHAPLNQPDGLTEFVTADQDALARSFKTKHMVEVAWPDTSVYADLSQVLSVAGDERVIMPSETAESDLTKSMGFLIVPAESSRHVHSFADDLTKVLQAQDLSKFGVRICRLVTSLEHPNEFLRKTFDHPGLRAVAGITMFLKRGEPWEMPSLAEALIQTTSTAFEIQAYAFSMLVTPNIVVNRPLVA